MKRSNLRLPSPALVIACLALAVALSGAGYAAVTLPRASVGTKQLKNNAVNSAKIKNGSLVPADFKGGTLNANLLDGLDSTAFTRGDATISRVVTDLTPGQTAFFLTIAGFIDVYYQCPGMLPNDAEWGVHNISAGTMNLFVDLGAANPTFFPVTAGGTVPFAAAAAGDSISINAQSGTSVAAIEFSSIQQGGVCHVQAVATRAL